MMFTTEETESRWFALRVRTKCAVAAANAIDHKGFEVFLPSYTTLRRRADRVKALESPLFPGYLFCRFDPTSRLLPILTTPGVISIVCSGKSPAPISQKEISAIQSVVRSGLKAAPYLPLSAGVKVLIEKGPLAGIEGLVLTLEKGCWLVISVDLLQRAVIVHIEREWVRPIATQPVYAHAPVAHQICNA